MEYVFAEVKIGGIIIAYEQYLFIFVEFMKFSKKGFHANFFHKQILPYSSEELAAMRIRYKLLIDKKG